MKNGNWEVSCTHTLVIRGRVVRNSCLVWSRKFRVDHDPCCVSGCLHYYFVWLGLRVSETCLCNPFGLGPRTRGWLVVLSTPPCPKVFYVTRRRPSVNPLFTDLFMLVGPPSTTSLTQVCTCRPKSSCGRLTYTSPTWVRRNEVSCPILGSDLQYVFVYSVCVRGVSLFEESLSRPTHWSNLLL